MFWQKALRFCFVLALVLALQACSNYRWGSPGMDTLPFQTLYIKPVINRTFIPQAQALLSQQIIRNLQQSNICITQCEEDADAVLVIVLSNYIQTTSTTERFDTTLASSFTVFVEARCTLVNNATCQNWFTDRCVSASINAEANDSVQQVLYQDMPVLTAKLADQIRNLVVGTW